jgi:hypothetical protein
MLPAEATKLAELEPFSRLLLVLRRAVVTTLALAARELNDVSHWLNLVRLSALGLRPALSV